MNSMTLIRGRLLLPVYLRCCSSQRKYSTENAANLRLFTPGPLNTTYSVKAAMLRDIGSRDSDFIAIIDRIRTKLLKVAGVSSEEYTAVPMQGSGTFAVEATVQTAVPQTPGATVLVLSGGAYGERIAKICKYLGIEHDLLTNAPNSVPNLVEVEKRLKNRKYANVSVVHCDTSSGIVNPVDDIGSLVKQCQPDCSYVVDAMSSFGAMPIPTSHADFIVSSANKCLQGVPGCGLVITRKSKLLDCKGNSRSVSLDLYEQYEIFEKTGMFRFTPSTHVMLALNQALTELEDEGGVEGRANRYKNNHTIVTEGMKKLGFQTFLPPENSSYIITSYRYPTCPNFDFETFYQKLKARGQVLYPGKVTKEDCFRIGNIGDLHAADMEKLLECIREVCIEMEISL